SSSFGKPVTFSSLVRNQGEFCCSLHGRVVAPRSFVMRHPLKCLWVLSLVVILAGPVSLPAQHQSPVFHQLLVGISEYPRLQPQSQLRFAHKDALDLGAVLAAPAGQARILVNGQATLRGILANLEDLTHRARPGDWALVLLSGHGGFAGVLNSEWC